MIENIEVKLGLREKKVKSDEEKYDLVGVEDSMLSEAEIKRKRI